MKQKALKINRPSLTATWTAEQMDNAKVRIHQRFQGLVTSIIESADWGNFKLTPNPVEVGRPAFPDPGAYCDLYLSRRQANGVDNKVIAAMEIKTRSVSLTDRRPPYQIAESVLEKMSSNLIKLQTHAKSGGVLWIVCIGLYYSPFQTMAQEFNSDFEVVMYWGRDVGPGQPMGRARWSSLSLLDKSICDFTEPSQFWSLASSHKPSPPPAPPQLEPPTSSTLFPPSIRQGNEDVSFLIKKITEPNSSDRACLMSALEWPNQGLRDCDGFLKWSMACDCSYDAARLRCRKWVKRGVLNVETLRRGYKRLSINKEALMKYAQSQGG
jgi:hypothetical protein